MKQEILTIGVILKTHKIIALNSCLKPNEKGYFRTVPVWVGGREGIKHDKIRKAMDQWIVNAMDVVNNGKKEPKEFLVELINAQHVVFEKIHPCVDINGRLGRLLLNWTRLQLGLPILIIHAGKEQMEYYKWFR
jgi:Fic family protein